MGMAQPSALGPLHCVASLPSVISSSSDTLCWYDGTLQEYWARRLCISSSMVLGFAPCHTQPSGTCTTACNTVIALPARARALEAHLTMAAAACSAFRFTPAWAHRHGLLLQALHGHVVGRCRGGAARSA